MYRTGLEPHTGVCGHVHGSAIGNHSDKEKMAPARSGTAVGIGDTEKQGLLSFRRLGSRHLPHNEYERHQPKHGKANRDKLENTGRCGNECCTCGSDYGDSTLFFEFLFTFDGGLLSNAQVPCTAP